jgi:hypothetical protein
MPRSGSEGKIIAVPSAAISTTGILNGQVIRQALFNALQNRDRAFALGALFGGKSENWMRSFRIGERNPRKCNMTHGKRKQPVIHGALDSKALKTSRIRRTLVQKFGVKPGPIACDNAKTQRALENMAGDKLTAFHTGYEETTGKKVKRINPALALLGRASEDNAFYLALFDYLVETAPFTQAELETLAEKRATVIIQDLTARAGADAARITVGPVVQTEGQDESVPAKLELTVD